MRRTQPQRPICSGASRPCSISTSSNTGRYRITRHALSITPTHLSRLVRTATGHAASHLILDRVIREARRNLVYTNLPVSTIAYALGFNDPAYFSRLFSGATGLSPRRFRDKIQKAA